jgi:hypothetical protein
MAPAFSAYPTVGATFASFSLCAICPARLSRNLLCRCATSLMIDYYKVLGVSQSASETEIKRAFRILAQRHHPDRSNAHDAAGQFIRVAEAYEVLRDSERRRVYDSTREESAETNPAVNYQRSQRKTSFDNFAAESRAKAERYSKMPWSEMVSTALDDPVLHSKYAYYFGCGPVMFIGMGAAALALMPFMFFDSSIENPLIYVFVVGPMAYLSIKVGLNDARELSEKYKGEKSRRAR